MFSETRESLNQTLLKNYSELKCNNHFIILKINIDKWLQSEEYIKISKQEEGFQMPRGLLILLAIQVIIITRIHYYFKIMSYSSDLLG